MDTNKDRRISYDEFEGWFKNVAGKPEVPRGLWEKEDQNQDKYISWEEFSGPKGSSADEL